MSEEQVAEQIEEKSGAVLFELENIGMDGRKVMYDVVQKVLSAKGIDIKPFTFSRYALNVSLTRFIETIVEINKKKLDVGKLVDDIEAKATKALLSSATANAQLKSLIKKAAPKDIKVGALSSLDDAAAKDLLGKIGIGDIASNLLCSHNVEKCCHSADAWLKLAKNMDVSPSKCVVISTCKVSSRSALKAGMRCVAIPDSFTSFQDFGGADMVAEKMNDDLCSSIFELIETEQI